MLETRDRFPVFAHRRVARVDYFSARRNFRSVCFESLRWALWIGVALLVNGCTYGFFDVPPVPPDPQAARLGRAQTTSSARIATMQQMKRRLHPAAQGFAAAQRLLVPSLPNTQSLGANATPAASAANFAGNLTGIFAPAQQGFVLQRRTDCSLTLVAGNYSLDSSKPALVLQNISTTPNFERALHDAAGLGTAADRFPAGCAAPTGTGTGIVMYLGTTPQDLLLFANPGYDYISGADALYTTTVDPATNSVVKLVVDKTDPNLARIAAGDLDGDGLNEIIALDHGNGGASIAVRHVQADGTVGPAKVYALPGSQPEAAVVDDVNGDGKADVVVASIDGTTAQEYLSVLTGNGDGSLNSAVSIQISTPLATTSSFPGTARAPIVNLISADLRGNGHKDVVASNGQVFLNAGNGSFSASAAAAFAPGFATSVSGPHLAAGDFDRDGRVDLVVSDGTELDIYLGHGDGSFSAGNRYASNGSLGYISVADLDGDGNPDLYVGIASGGIFGADPYSIGEGYAVMGNGDGTFRGAPVMPAAFTGQNLADLNGDKKPDLVGLSGSTFTTYLARGDGSFANGASLDASHFSSGGVTYSSASILGYTLADVNADGYPDLIWITDQVDVATARTFFFVALNKHDGSFAAPTVNEFPSLVSGSDFETYFAVDSVQAGDFNHDGKPDLLFDFSESTYQGSAYQIGYFVLPGNGNGTFGTPRVLHTGTAPSSSFSPPLPPPAAAATIDFNGDGNADLLSLQTLGIGSLPGGGFGTQLVLYSGKGDGSFGAATNIPAAPNPFAGPGHVVAADMNGDGHPDLVSLGQTQADGNGYLSISLNNGDGSFAPPTTYVLGAQGITFDGIAVADFNGDGKLDVALTNFEVPGGLLFGNGDGTLATPNIDSVGKVLPTQTFIIAGGGTVTAADINGDGSADVVSGNVVLLNLTPGSTTGPSGGVNLDQHGLTGSWYNPLTGGQGLLLDVSPDLLGAGQGLLFGGWFTFDVAPAGGAEKQRWYTLQGAVSSGNPVATVPIYAVYGGNFNALPKPPPLSQVGTATFNFSDCTHGTLAYRFSDGSNRSGTIPLTRLSNNVSCSPAGDSGAALSDYALAGTFYDPNIGGQGLLFDVSPSQNVLFSAWYTFAPDGATIGGPSSQRWYTLQAPFSPGVSSLSNLPIFATVGGVFDDPTKPSLTQVGTATLTYSGCNAATLQYTFSGGSNQGQTGTIHLSRLDPEPAGCGL